MSEAAFVIPRITTDRLVLRELRLADFDAYAANAADPVAMKHMSGAVDRRMAWRFFAALTGQWALAGAGWWAVEIAETGELAGTVGCFFRETQLGLGAEADIELGWSLHPPFWRRGFATEAARAALAFAFARHEVRGAVAYVDKPNIASIGVCKAIGMSFEGDADFYGETVARYAVKRRA